MNYNEKHVILDNINDQLLEKLGNDVNELKQVMDETGASIYGTFIVSCMLGEKWDDSKIDIIVKDGSEKKLLDFFKKIKPRGSNSRRNSYTIYGFSNLGIIVYVTKDNFEIDNLLSFDPCKSYYRINNGAEELHISGYDQIVNKTIKFAFPDKLKTYHYKETLLRYQHYKEYGFKFYHDGYDSLFDCICDNAIIVTKDGVKQSVP